MIDKKKFIEWEYFLKDKVVCSRYKEEILRKMEEDGLLDYWTSNISCKAVLFDLDTGMIEEIE